MTEWERQAFKSLSAQYETEQRRHSEQIEALQQRVEPLSGQVTRFGRDYRTLAARLRGLWT